MKRRGFLATLLGLAAAPAAAKLPVPAAEPMFVGIAHAGEQHIRWQRIPEVTPEGARIYSRHLFTGHRWRDDEICALQREVNRRASLALNKLRGDRWA